jgi:hypothetical protein
MIRKKKIIVCLNDISINQIEKIISEEHNWEIQKIYVSQSQFDILSEKINNIKKTEIIPNQFLITPCNSTMIKATNFNQELSEIVFVCNPKLSKDGYLMGNTYFLATTLNAMNLKNELSFHLFLELSLFYKCNEFITFINENEYKKGNSWEIDYSIITHLNLRTDFIYKNIYRRLIQIKNPFQFVNLAINKSNIIVKRMDLVLFLNIKKIGQKLLSPLKALRITIQHFRFKLRQKK